MCFCFLVCFFLVFFLATELSPTEVWFLKHIKGMCVAIWRENLGQSDPALILAFCPNVRRSSVNLSLAGDPWSLVLIICSNVCKCDSNSTIDTCSKWEHDQGLSNDRSTQSTGKSKSNKCPRNSNREGSVSLNISDILKFLRVSTWDFIKIWMVFKFH